MVRPDRSGPFDQNSGIVTHPERSSLSTLETNPAIETVLENTVSSAA